MPFDIFDIIQLWCQRIQDVDNDDLPIGLTLVEKGHDTKDLDLLDLTSKANLFSYLAYIEGVVVSLCLCLSMRLVGIFPCLR